MTRKKDLTALTTEELINIILDLQEKVDVRQLPGDAELKSKRTIKDSVFTNLFRDINYTLKIYQALHPEDTSVTADDIKIMTLESHLGTNSIMISDLWLETISSYSSSTSQHGAKIL